MCLVAIVSLQPVSMGAYVAGGRSGALWKVPGLKGSGSLQRIPVDREVLQSDTLEL